MFAADKESVEMNMFSKSVTLEVLKLSAWLKAVACPNMACMSLTLEVSKLSG